MSVMQTLSLAQFVAPQRMIGSAVSPMPGGVLAAFSLRVAFPCNAALFCCGALVSRGWLGARREGSLPAEPTGAEG